MRANKGPSMEKESSGKPSLFSHDLHRRTGKTFRALLNALVDASNGQTVVYECASDAMAKWTIDKACRIAGDFMEVELKDKRTIKIGEGWVYFSRPINAFEAEEIRHRHKIVRDLT